MSAELLNFELVSPEAKLVEEPVKMAVIPGEEGELGVGANHASFVVALKPGVVALHKDDGGSDIHKIFITGGFADISDAGCSVLAEEATPLRDLDKSALESKLKDLNEDLGLATEDADKARVQREIDLTAAKLSALKAA